METGQVDNNTDAFTALKPRLLRIAYRMLGSRADAEDAVQDAYLRCHDAQGRALRSNDAWMITVLTNLCIDRLRRAKVEREAYIGPWLPEPIVVPPEQSPDFALQMAGEISMAFMVVLERLGPEERAVFLLHQVFDYDYAEIAAVLGKSQAACRQILHRAKQRVQQGRPRFQVDPALHRRLVMDFVAAARAGNQEAMTALLAPDATYTADGGGKAVAVLRVVQGADKIARLHAGLARKWGAHTTYEVAVINGEAGVLRRFDGTVDSTISFSIAVDRIDAIYVVRNPDKLLRRV